MSEGAAGALSADAIFAALEATWPPVRWHAAEGWRVAEGRGGGKRVSCAVATRSGADPAAMAAAQAALGQPPLAMVRGDGAAQDAALAGAGLAMIDPTVALVAPVQRIAAAPPAVTVFTVDWPPLACQDEIWDAGGIGAARRGVMARATGPKITLLGRMQDRPVGTAFVACAGGIAMVHALEILPRFRRRGLARHMMGAAALWAGAEGANALAALVTRRNIAALALYRALGMEEAAAYHYRGREEDPR